ncbi:MAG: S-layer homology domain-containing protein [Clostridia bacterium]|nr:S-layer homology domain-containing protein [Clostridia bacterium]
MKKIISFISFVLVLVMLTSGATVFGAEAKFKDFDWYVGEFGWNGFPDGLFHPERTMTRAELIVQIAQYYTAMYFYAHGWEDMGGFKKAPDGDKIFDSFRDVPSNAWYRGALKWACENGLIKGCGNGRFDPDRTITVYEYAIIWNRFWTLQGLGNFIDGKTKEEYYGIDYEHYDTEHVPFASTGNAAYSKEGKTLALTCKASNVPNWFLQEASIEEVLINGIWIGGSGDLADTSAFEPTRGNLAMYQPQINWSYDFSSGS